MRSLAHLARGHLWLRFRCGNVNPVTLSRRTTRCYATQLNLPALDQKWRAKWMRDQFLENLNENTSDGAPTPSKEDNLYVLSMFPYPSGNLHLGHLRVYAIADVVARFRRMQGKNVMLPMGWDAFGLPAENAAMERGVDPAAWTKQNIAQMKEQLQYMNASFDWSRELATCDPEFYKHTQKIFLLLFENGLASQKDALVNWDPVDKTVLANEQVDAAGRSWRSGAKVEQRNLKQWFFHITKFQDALYRDLEALTEYPNAWPKRVLAMQKNWLGRTSCAYYGFQIQSIYQWEPIPAKVYTTRPETIFAAQFLALSPQSPIVEKLADSDAELRSFLQQVKDLTPESMEGYRIPYLTATSPLEPSRGPPERIPVYAAPYVRGDYETGALMGVPAHDLRDFAFWKRHHPDEPIKYAVTPEKDGSVDSLNGAPYVNSGYMTSVVESFEHWGSESESFKNRPSESVADAVVKRIREQSGRAESIVKWKLRDWLVSRQRYWGTPIPIIHCDSCGPQPVPDNQLPVTLPRVDHHWADGKTGNPLETATEWVNTTCPKCHGPAKRDTDTMDTFVDSSWYYMRFADPANQGAPISKFALENYLPVDIYIGGVEHAILHLLYARFIYKAVAGLLYPLEIEYSEEDAAYRHAMFKKVWSDPSVPTKVRKLVGTAAHVIENEGLVEIVSMFDSKEEPFRRLVTQGMVHGKTYSDPATGRFLKPDEVDLSNPSDPRVVATGQPATVTFEKMSKSKHNGVDPTKFIAKYGADATRAQMLFAAPVSDVVNWDEDKIVGVTRWLSRLFNFVQALPPVPEDGDVLVEEYFEHSTCELEAAERAANITVWLTTQNTITTAAKSYANVYSLNTTISVLMGMTNVLTASPAASPVIKTRATGCLLRMMAPITPAFAEECWSILHPGAKSIFHKESGGWPEPDGSLKILEEMYTGNYIKCAVMINGKLRCVAQIPNRPPSDVEEGSDAYKGWITKQIIWSEEARSKLENLGVDIRKAKKVFPVKGGKTVNYVM